MKLEYSLLEHLQIYSQSDYYPFHMPGHKRQYSDTFAMHFPNPFAIDITEVEGFDNLHNPEGILKESMEWAASVYGADRTYYLVNGSSCGILSAICGTTNNLDTILMSRNSHKSAYHGVFLNHLRVKYIYPQILDDFCVQSGLLLDEIERMLKTHNDIKAIFVVSPTYEGIVSDIKTIAKIAHKYKIPLIVDEAHGAHFRYGEDFPVSALDLGADVVIQSLHKTLPSFTQTALMHVKKGYVDIDKIERYLHIYQSSSPSYLFMSGIEHCIRWMEGDRGERMKVLANRIQKLRNKLGQMQHLRLLDKSAIGYGGFYDLDQSKIVIGTNHADISGPELSRILRENYHLEMEMCGPEYVVAITTVADTKEGLERLEHALMEIDENIGEASRKHVREGDLVSHHLVMPQIAMTIYKAINAENMQVLLEKSVGRISTEYIYIYPPGIPIVAPGEVLQKEIVEMVLRYQLLGLSVQGSKDMDLRTIQVVRENETWEK